MANEIDLVVGQVAFDKITELIGRLKDVDTEFGKIADKFSNLGKTGNPQSTAELAKLTAENEKLNKALNDLKSSYTTIDTELAKNTKLITDATLATKAKTAADTLALKATEDQNSAYVKSAGLYANLDAQHKLAVKNAQDLAVETGRTGIKYEEAKNKANELGKQLRVIDTDIGKHTRNVGNYSSSWNGLGNSINQLTREAPAFANSVQTGFMALSNNIPILTDELGVLIQKNKDLQAEGKPTQSILKTVAGAFFSWQTVISLGVTILTVYGAKLYEMAKAAYESSKGIVAASEAQKLLNTAISEGNKNAAEEVGHFRTLYATATNLALSQKERKDATNEMQKLYPKVLGNIKAEIIQNGLAKDSYYLIRDAIIAKSRASAISSALDKAAAEEFAKESELRLQLDLEMQDLYKKKRDVNLAETKYKNKEITWDNMQNVKASYDFQLITVKGINKEILDLNKNLNKEQDILLKARQKEDKKAAIIIPPPKAESKGKDKTEDVERKAIKSVNELEKVDTLLGRINTEIERLKVEKIVANAEELPAVNFQLEMLYNLRSQLNELPVGGALPDNFVKPEQIEGVKQLTKEMQSYLNSFGAEFASKAGLSETFNMLSGNIEGFGENAAVTFVAVAESAQEMFNIIAEASAANYDAEYARLDKQKTEAIKNAGDSTVAKEKIEADYEKKKKEIQLREFKAKQKITIANIAIDTAQAIVSTYAQVPKYDFGVSATTLAFIIAGLGAAQIGMVASQKPPAYAEGTDNHSGGLMLVNDGAGSNFQEKVILPSGKVIRPQGRNVLMDAPKGTKVLNHEQQLFEMLQSNNISMSSQQSSGLTYDEMNEIFQNNFANIKTQNTIFDKNGFQTYVRNGNSITRSNSNRSQAIGISV